MKNSELKKLIKETVEEVKKENVDKIINEALEHDLKLMQEEYELRESLIAEGLMDESELDEGFFDTVGALGKNAFKSVAASWKKAKAQGDKAAEKRAAEKLKKMKQAEKAGGGKPVGKKQEPIKDPKTGKVLQPGDHGYTAAYAKATGQKVATNKGQETPPAEKAKILKQSAVEIMNDIKENDPEGFQKLASMEPEQIDALVKKSGKIKQAGEAAKKQIAAKPKKGLLRKVNDWIKENPVKAAVGLGALGSLAAAVAVPGLTIGALVSFGLTHAGTQLAMHTAGTSLVKTMDKREKARAKASAQNENEVPETELSMEQWEQKLEEELDNKINEINSRIKR
jgi:hypothetical protein